MDEDWIAEHESEAWQVAQALTDEALDVLRMLCRREPSACRVVADPRFFHRLCAKAAQPNVRAVKALCNVLFYSGESRRLVGECGHFSSIVDGALQGDDQAMREYSLRLLFFASIDVDTKAKLQNVPLKLFPEMPLQSDNALLFALRLVYSVSDAITSMEHIDVLLAIMNDSQRPANVRGAAVNVLLKAESVSRLDCQVVCHLLTSFLAEEADYFPSIVLLVTRKAGKDVLLDLKHRIIPGTIDRSISIDDERNGRERSELIKALRHSDPDISLAAGDLLLALVDNSVKRLIYHTGYGNIAGYLFMRGLSGALDAGEYSHSENELEGVDAVTGMKEIKGGLGMTEEEKNGEAARLMNLFERLERTGVVQIIPKK